MCILSECVTINFCLVNATKNWCVHNFIGKEPCVFLSYTVLTISSRFQLLHNFYILFFLFLASFKSCWVHSTEEWWAGNCKWAAFNPFLVISGGGAVASWLGGSTPDRVVQVQALAGNIVLCSLARWFTLTVPLSTQLKNWVPGNLMLLPCAIDQHPIQGEGRVEIFLDTSCYWH